MALAARIQGAGYRVYCLLGDGELHEGQVWEAAMTAPRLCLTNLTTIVDHNGLKAMDDAARCGKPLSAPGTRWAGFGWHVREIDGHDMAQICDALDWATSLSDAPGVIVAHTIKGKGVSFMENRPAFHNASITEEQFKQAVMELEAGLL
jgi:transketolase